MSATPHGLTVVQIAYAFAPVTADPAGGAEQVLAQCDRAVVAAGHRSIVVAREGSETAGELAPFAVPDTPEPAWIPVHDAMRARIAQVLADARPDVIHCHGIDFGAYLPPPGPPVLATLHLPIGWYSHKALRPRRPRTFLQPVSADQAARAPADVPLIAPVPNGVDCDLYRPGAKGRELLVLGRVSPDKGSTTRSTRQSARTHRWSRRAGCSTIRSTSAISPRSSSRGWTRAGDGSVRWRARSSGSC